MLSLVDKLILAYGDDYKGFNCQNDIFPNGGSSFSG